MQLSRFSTLFFAASLGFLSVSCTGSDGVSRASGGGGLGGGSGGGGGSLPTESLDDIDLDADPDGDRIVDVPSTVDPLFQGLFTRYTAVETSAGRIHILGQSGVSDAKLARSRSILALHLTPVAGSTQGGSKEDVITAMVQRGALAAIFNDTASIDPANVEVADLIAAVQDTSVLLPADRIILEGSSQYAATLPAEDNTFGVLAALVHRTGLVHARPEFASQLDDLAASAAADGLFTPASQAIASEGTAAFLITAMDVHSGVFGHDPSGDGIAAGTAGSLEAIDRASLDATLPRTADWLGDFFSADHSFEAILPESFTGNFDGLRRTSTPYSARSQHLRNIRMTGSNGGEIFGAPFDSTLTGNSGNNNLKGRRGYDTIDGGLGFDTAVFSGPQSDYRIEVLSDRVIVEDVLGGHEQLDTLFGIERLQFTDGGFNL
ncbi:MAG: AcrR family transcriptional regulator [Planctomycetota bacterium]|jgi:AcrR family transcriptional regulator